MTDLLFKQWVGSLPVLAMWAAGLVLAVKRWRERPQISKLVVIACGVGLFAGIFMPVAMLIVNQMNSIVFTPLLTLVWALLGALCIGLLLKAVFLVPGQSDPNASEKPSQSGVTVINGPIGTALKILAGIVRWTWQVFSILPFLFLGVFLLAGGIPKTLMHPSEWGLDDMLATGALLLIFAALVLAWRWEWLGGTIIFLIGGIPTLIGFGKGDRGDLPDAFVGALGMFILLSWALNTLKDAKAKPLPRRIALILIPLLVISIGLCVYRMPGARFNP
ncbi:MAG TPA: hypothetical protein VMB80_04405 [Candidatus Acidoferrum sp.]|nr:hypothetical protein [Candidatus Acidoferrum sp.]